jgi:large subunit ribosomal protein L19e
MKLKTQKRLAADVLKCSPKRVIFDEERLEDIKESITKADIRALVIDKAISKKNKKGVSRIRARKRQIQRKKGKQRGQGTRKGKKTARTPKKITWMNKIRTQRNLLRNLKEKELIDNKTFRELYKKTKGGYFRSRRHIKIYLEEHGLIKKVENKKDKTKEVNKTTKNQEKKSREKTKKINDKKDGKKK